MGASWGGLRAVNTILEGLPPWFLPPVVIVQHRRAGPHTDLVRSFASRSAVPVLEPVDKSAILSGHVYVAPADYHLLVGRDGFALTIDEPRSFSRPSIDELFHSAAEAFGAEAAGVLLTGASDDGAAGLARIRHRGGVGVVQDPETAERRQMPDAALAAGGALRVLPLDQIAPFLIAVCGPSVVAQ